MMKRLIFVGLLVVVSLMAPAMLGERIIDPWQAGALFYRD